MRQFGLRIYVLHLLEVVGLLFVFIFFVFYLKNTWIYPVNVFMDGRKFARPFDQCTSRAKSFRLIRCPWPPDNLNDLVNFRTGRYDLTLRPLVIRDAKTGRLTSQYENWAKIAQPEDVVNGSWLKRLVHRDAKAREADINSNYDLYPQIADTVELVKAVREGRPVNEDPINDPMLDVLAYPRSICNQTNNIDTRDLIVFIKTCSGCFSNRNTARDTFAKKRFWPRFKIDFVFVVGIPEKYPQKWYRFDGVTVPRHQPSAEAKLDRTEKIKAIFNESREFGDVLIGNFEDNYYNVSLKMAFTFRWAATFCRKQAPIYLFMDDDQTIIPLNLMKLIRRIPSNIKREFSGGYTVRTSVVRPDKTMSRWAVSEDEIPWSLYPPYYITSFLMGSEVVAEFSVAVAFTRHFRIDDSYQGFIMKKLRRPHYSLQEITGVIDKSTEVRHLAVLPNIFASPVNWVSAVLVNKKT